MHLLSGKSLNVSEMKLMTEEKSFKEKNLSGSLDSAANTSKVAKSFMTGYQMLDLQVSWKSLEMSFLHYE